MSKYNELMSRIEMTPQMKARILEKLEKSSPNKLKKSNVNKIIYFGIVAAAACLVLVVGSAIMKNNSITPNNQKVDSCIYTEDIYSSAAELAKASGKDIKDLHDIPFDVKKTKYVLITNQIAQISYFDEHENEICYRMTKGEEDNSGVYDEFEKEDTVNINGIDVTIKGNNGNASVATWTVSGYSYSIYATSDISVDEMKKMIE